MEKSGLARDHREALPGALLTRWNERFKSDIYDGIGSAEMFHIYASNRPGDVKPGSLGKAVEDFARGFDAGDGSSVVPGSDSEAMDADEVEDESVRVNRPAPTRK